MRTIAIAGLTLFLSSTLSAQGPPGSIVWGGKVVGATRTGGNVTGKAIEGGTTQKLSKGDFFVVPPGTARRLMLAST